MIKTITAIERDGLDLTLITVVFEIPDADFNLLDAIKLAVADYLKTDEGKKVAEYNCGYFNLADVVNSLPRKYCENRGFKLLDAALTDEEIDWDYEFNEEE